MSEQEEPAEPTEGERGNTGEIKPPTKDGDPDPPVEGGESKSGGTAA